MSQEWLTENNGDQAFRSDPLPGVAPAIVIENVDSTGQGRVQLELPWLFGIKPWARVASADAGKNRGFYMIPQVGDEVLIAFAHGDVREPYVIGALWNLKDLPPYTTPEAPRAFRSILTPLGHVLEFDDLRQTISLKAMGGQRIYLTPTEISLTPKEGISTKITIGIDGSIKIVGETSIEMSAINITLKGTNVKVESDTNVQIKAGAMCDIQAGLVKIN